MFPESAFTDPLGYLKKLWHSPTPADEELLKPEDVVIPETFQATQRALQEADPALHYWQYMHGLLSEVGDAMDEVGWDKNDPEVWVPACREYLLNGLTVETEFFILAKEYDRGIERQIRFNIIGQGLSNLRLDSTCQELFRPRNR